MRVLLVGSACALLGLACALEAEREVVLTRDQLGPDWPLQVNSATVLCSDEGGAVLKVGTRRYALDEDASSRGYPPAREIAIELPVDPMHPEIGSWPADTEPLRAACDKTPAVATR